MRKATLGFLPSVLFTLAIWLLAPVNGLAQYRAGIQGVLTDPSGAVVQGATLTLTSKETGIVRTATSSDAGVFAITNLAPGHYTLKVSRQGFKTQTLEDVVVGAEGIQAINVQLALGQLVQNVSVTAPVAPAINTENATISGTLTSQQIQALPLAGSDPFQLLRLAPGVFGDGALNAGGGTQNLPGNAGPGGTSATSSIFQTENQVQVVANGTRNISNSFQIDGVEVNSLAWGGAAVITPNPSSVKEVKVVANNYSAEFGRNSGAQVLVVSQNGTNQFHGGAFFKFHRPGLNAFQRWNGPNNTPTQKDTNRFNQFGGSLGGPIVRNKLFFFVSYDTLRNDAVNTGTGWYETPQLLKMASSGSIAGDLLSYPGEGVSFNQIVNKSCADAGITNPLLCQPVVVNGQYAGLDVGSPLNTPLGTTDPGFVNNGNFGNGNGLDGIPDVMFVQTTNPVTNTSTQYNTRFDYQATDKDLVTFSLYRVPVKSTFYNGPIRPANLWHHTATNHAETALWNRTLSATMINEARFGVSGWYWNEVTSNPQEPWGLPIDSTDCFAAVCLNSWGAPGPSIFDQKTYNIRDTLSKVQNSHLLKFGADIYYEQDDDEAPWAARPSYNFRNLWDFVNDAPYHEFAIFDPQTGQPTSVKKDIRSDIYAFFVQDDYKMRPNLTLNLGLRWEYFGPIHEAKNAVSNVVLGSAPDPLTNLRLKVGGNLYSSSKNNWGPQIGFAWSPHSMADRLVVRGGYGIGYNRMQEAITLNGRFNPPFSSFLDLFGSNILYAVPCNVHQFSPWPTNPNAIETFDPNTGLPASGAPVSLTGIPTSLATPVTYRYSLETQYEFIHNWTATIGYQGSQTRHYTRQVFLNWLYSPLNPGVQSMDYYPNDANASYNAMLVEVQHSLARTFQVDFQYRFSRTTDEGSNDYYVDQYPFNVIYSRGPADFDATHNFKLWGVWSPRFFPENDWRGKVIGGWEISGILDAHSGFPWTPVYGNTSCNIIYQGSGYCTLRPAQYLGGAGSDYSNSTFMSNTGNFPNGALSYFTVPTFQQGPAFPNTGPIPPAPSVGRNSFRGPRYFDTDMSLSKAFGLPKTRALGENAKFELRADFFNIFNKLNLNPTSISNTISFDGTTSNPHFGQAQSALGARVVELQMRFNF